MHKLFALRFQRQKHQNAHKLVERCQTAPFQTTRFSQKSRKNDFFYKCQLKETMSSFSQKL